MQFEEFFEGRYKLNNASITLSDVGDLQAYSVQGTPSLFVDNLSKPNKLLQDVDKALELASQQIADLQWVRAFVVGLVKEAQGRQYSDPDIGDTDR